ncbi:conserved hypothetical protein [Gammaproteobacteria bacterium]
MTTSNNLLIEFYINDKHIQEIITPETLALELIREKLGLTGTKEPCGEGDCGGCTIALGSWKNNHFQYQAINSCILPASRLHGCHVITTEGLARGQKLHLIQKEMLEQHAVQCGFCTAGIIMSIFCLFSNNPSPNKSEIVNALSGNLCRCTGYKFINDAILSISDKIKRFPDLLPDYASGIQHKLRRNSAEQPIPGKLQSLSICKNYYIPHGLDELFSSMHKLKGNFKIINGGTDLMVQGNIHDIWPEAFIDISQVPQLHFIKKNKNFITFGGSTTFGQLQANNIVKQKIPTFYNAIFQIASNQIRGVATPAGNIANASPIADSVCVLLALGAKLIILRKNLKRNIDLKDFYQDYKVTKLDATKEIISAIEVPNEQGFCNFEKSSKRSALDIATVNSCINIIIGKNNIIKDCRLAFGGVAKFPILAEKTSDFLVGKKLTKENIDEAACIAIKEFAPISDVRGSAEYRRILIQNHIIKHFNTYFQVIRD